MVQTAELSTRDDKEKKLQSSKKVWLALYVQSFLFCALVDCYCISDKKSTHSAAPVLAVLRPGQPIRVVFGGPPLRPPLLLRQHLPLLLQDGILPPRRATTGPVARASSCLGDRPCPHARRRRGRGGGGDRGGGRAPRRRRRPPSPRRCCCPPWFLADQLGN